MRMWAQRQSEVVRDRGRVPAFDRQEALPEVDLGLIDCERMAELVEVCADFPLGTTDAAVVAVAERLGREGAAVHAGELGWGSKCQGVRAVAGEDRFVGADRDCRGRSHGGRVDAAAPGILVWRPARAAFRSEPRWG